MTKNRKRQSGFGLVEILVAIAIIAILAAVLTPRILNARENAKWTAAKAMLIRVGEGLMDCADDDLLGQGQFKSTGGWPADVGRNTRPAGCPDLDWPDASELPFGSAAHIDYENWGHWVGITYHVNGRLLYGSNILDYGVGGALFEHVEGDIKALGSTLGVSTCEGEGGWCQD